MLERTKTTQHSPTTTTNKSHEEEEDEEKKIHFSHGLRVLAIDDNIVCLKVLASNLEKCGYQVTMTMEASEAIEMLRKNKNGYDIVITDVIRSDMDGFKLVEIVGLEMDIPVIMTSANSDIETIEKGVKHGARDYLVKPVRMEILKNIWQHVIRKTTYYPKPAQKIDEANNCNIIPTVKQHHFAAQPTCSEECSSLAAACKKPRIEWTPELHAKFVAAVQRLGEIGEKEKVVPKYILKFMNDPNLTRQQIASHLQKYRLALEKQNKQRERSRQESNNHNIVGTMGTKHPSCSASNFLSVPSINGCNLYGKFCFKTTTPNTFPITQLRQNLLLPFQDVYQGQPTENVPLFKNVLRPSPTQPTSNPSQSDHLNTIMHQRVRSQINFSDRCQQIPPQVHPPPTGANARGRVGPFTPRIDSIPNQYCNKQNIDILSQPRASSLVGNGHRFFEDSSSERTIFSQPNCKFESVPSYVPGPYEGRNMPMPAFGDNRSSVNPNWSAVATDPLLLDTRDQMGASKENVDFRGAGYLQNDSDKPNNHVHHDNNERYYDSDDEIGVMVRQFSQNPAPTL